MKKKYYSFFFYLAFCINFYAQVGINTTTPTEMLDVNGTLRVRSLPIIPNASLVGVDTNGKLGLLSSVPQFVLKETYDVTATTPVNQTIGSTATINNINLGLSIPVVIPANSTTKVIVTYSVPMGNTDAAGLRSWANTYLGIRFLKDGVEAVGGSRKNTLPYYTSSGIYGMLTIGATYIDTITNATASDITITYSLNGYLESGAGGGNFRFNMWAAPPAANFNWGQATMSAQVYSK